MDFFCCEVSAYFYCLPVCVGFFAFVLLNLISFIRPFTNLQFKHILHLEALVECLENEELQMYIFRLFFFLETCKFMQRIDRRKIFGPAGQYSPTLCWNVLVLTLLLIFSVPLMCTLRGSQWWFWDLDPWYHPHGILIWFSLGNEPAHDWRSLCISLSQLLFHFLLLLSAPLPPSYSPSF